MMAGAGATTPAGWQGLGNPVTARGHLIRLHAILLGKRDLRLACTYMHLHGASCMPLKASTRPRMCLAASAASVLISILWVCLMLHSHTDRGLCV